MAQTVTLTASNYNGYNISCFGSQTGNITATVTGGTPPYTYRWNNNATTTTLNNVPAGYYYVEVDDADPLTDVVIEEITLTQPEPLAMDELTPYIYTNGYNVSAYGACNGSITTIIYGGITPYAYRWEPGQQTVLAPTNLCANENILIVTDANGCEINQGIGLSEPERDDWTMNGNTNATNKFLGTVDNTDLSIKTYNQERLRVKANGLTEFYNDVNINTSLYFKNSKQISFQAAQGSYPAIMSFGMAPNTQPFAINCLTPTLNVQPLYQFGGTIQLFGSGSSVGTNNILEVGFDGYSSVIEATKDAGDPTRNRLLINYHCGQDAFICTGNTGGNVQIGGTNSLVTIGVDPYAVASQSTPYKLIVDGKVGVREVYVRTSGTWPDFVFEKNYDLMPFENVVAFYTQHKHLPDMPSAKEIETDGNYSLGKMQELQLQKLEELYLYTAQQKAEIQELKKQVAELKALLNN